MAIAATPPGVLARMEFHPLFSNSTFAIEWLRHPDSERDVGRAFGQLHCWIAGMRFGIAHPAAATLGGFVCRLQRVLAHAHELAPPAVRSGDALALLQRIHACVYVDMSHGDPREIHWVRGNASPTEMILSCGSEAFDDRSLIVRIDDGVTVRVLGAFIDGPKYPTDDPRVIPPTAEARLSRAAFYDYLRAFIHSVEADAPLESQ